jgi:NAD(P)-dependent dehydrogenase (short-subunit alcohol dehydrogenase family)
MNNMTVEQINQICIKGTCLKRIGQPQAISNLIVFVISDLYPFMTDANLILDGGSTIV